MSELEERGKWLDGLVDGLDYSEGGRIVRQDAKRMPLCDVFAGLEGVRAEWHFGETSLSPEDAERLAAALILAADMVRFERMRFGEGLREDL